MDTFKAICLPLAVVLLAVAAVIPPAPAAPAGTARWSLARWVLCGLALVLGAISLFVALDATS